MPRQLRWILVASAAALVLSGGLVVACRATPAAGPDPRGAGAPSTVASGSATPGGTPPSGPPTADSTPSGKPAPERPAAKTTGGGTLPPPTRSSDRDPDRSVPESELVRLMIPEILTGDSGGAISPDPATNELVPPKTSLVYRWAERGKPGSDADDTVYLLGHTVRAGGGVFDPLQQVEPGRKIIVETERGRLDYRVEATRMYPKNQIQQADEVYESVPGRLILVGCYLNADGSKQDLNFVVFAQLVS